MYILLIFIIIILLTSAFASWKGAPWVPTWSADIDRIIKLADIKKGERFIDLGCGDGRLVQAAARAGAQAIGYEISLLPFLAAKIRQLFARDNYKIYFKNFWEVNLGDTNIVYVFLTKKAYPRLKQKFEKELKKGTKVITYVWPLDGWKNSTCERKDKQPNLYLYIV